MTRLLHRAAFLAAVTLGLQLAQPGIAAERWQDGLSREFRNAGVAPMPGRGYAQPVRLEQQALVAARSSVAITEASSPEALSLLSDLVLDTTARQPTAFDAPLVFVGSRDPGPAALRGLQGKVAVMLEATAAAMEPAARAALEASGAVGVLTLASHAIDAAQAQPAVYLAGEGRSRFAATLSPEASARLFARAGLPYDDAVALAEAGRPVPGFDFNLRLKANMAFDTRTLASSNLVGVVKGSDPFLSREYVVVSAAASSAQAVVEAARQLHASGARPRRSIIFAVFAPERDGALGARAFALNPPAPRESLVANLGAASAPGEAAVLAVAAAEETSLGGLALDLAPSARPAATLASAGLSTPYRFLEAGVPSVLLTFGAGSSPNAGYLLALALKVSDSDAHPGWTRGSRFAPRAPQAQADLVAPVDLPRDHKPTPRLSGLAQIDSAPHL